MEFNFRTDDLDEPHIRALAQWELLALMAWPHNEERRRQYLAPLVLELRKKLIEACDQSLDEILEEFSTEWLWRSKEDYDAASQMSIDWIGGKMDEITGFYLDTFSDKLGGLDSLVENPPFHEMWGQIEKEYPRIILAGEMLLDIISMAKHHAHQIRGGASVKKAIYLVQNIANMDDFPTNEASLKKLWSEKKCVAHLCAAFHAITAENVEPATKTDRTGTSWGIHVKDFRSIAFAAQDFVTSFTPSGREQPIAGPEDIFVLPESLRPRDGDADVLFPELEPHELEVLAGYRAPAPY